jgi:rhodanese-related sulfurtransferase
MRTQSISAAELQAMLARGSPIDLIDVRTEAEFGEAHLKPARNIPWDQLDPAHAVATRTGSAEQPIYVICHLGGRGKLACQKFIATGFSNVVNVEGGIVACQQAGMDVIQGVRHMPLERQVRIVAGGLTLIGALLALTVDSNWALLSAFIGVGLVFAGFTDTCGLGFLLAKMPWNRVRQSTGEQATDTCALPRRPV